MTQIVISLFLIFVWWPVEVKVEGCVSCHTLIEPMHKYGTTDTLDKLKDGIVQKPAAT